MSLIYSGVRQNPRFAQRLSRGHYRFGCQQFGGGHPHRQFDERGDYERHGDYQATFQKHLFRRIVFGRRRSPLKTFVASAAASPWVELRRPGVFASSIFRRSGRPDSTDVRI
jgi:hypothetical protein